MLAGIVHCLLNIHFLVYKDYLSHFNRQVDKDYLSHFNRQVDKDCVLSTDK